MYYLIELIIRMIKYILRPMLFLFRKVDGIILSFTVILERNAHKR